MQYRQLNNNTYCLRLDVGDEIIKNLTQFCREQKIMSGYFTGIGATDDVTIGVFDTQTKKYLQTKLTGSYEITNLTGNITTKDNEIYLHAHINLGDHSLIVRGGHLNRAVISITCEIFITRTECKLERVLDEKTGINVIKL
jgi:predicted DNA-binding protein with PD1-like motif